MSELKRLEQEALRELAEKSRRDHDVERVVNAARAFRMAYDLMQNRPAGPVSPEVYRAQIETLTYHRRGLWDALDALGAEEV